jgi:hypothetical protein
METIEVNRVRLYYSVDAQVEEAEIPAEILAAILQENQDCAVGVKLVLAWLLKLRTAAAAAWRVDRFPNARVPSVGLFEAGSEWPLLSARLYVRGRGTLEVELHREPDFPYPLHVVVAHMQRYFPRVEVIQQARQVVTQLPDRSPAAASFLPPKRFPPGAPPLACNVWLEQELARLSDPEQFRALYEPWLARYYALQGYYPTDPHRSFRAAVASAWKRLRRKGGKADHQ